MRHRRAVTGPRHSCPEAFVLAEPSVLAIRARNLGASSMLVALASTIYLLSPYNQNEIDKAYDWVGVSFTGREFLAKATLAYIVLLLGYYAFEPRPGISKSVVCL